MMRVRHILLPMRRAGLRRCLHRLVRMGMTRVGAPHVLGPRLQHRKLRGPLPQTPPAVADTLARLAAVRAAGEAGDAWDTARQTVALLGQAPFPLLARPDGQAPPVSDPLWTFTLHGWEWAWLRLTDAATKPALNDALSAWWAANPMGRGHAWEPYPTARRLIVWCAAFHLQGLDRRWADHLAATAAYLAWRLEHDLDNNHLFVNLKALVWFDLLFPDARGPRVRAGSRTAFMRVLSRHLRPDGFQFENSSGYHLGTWLDVLDVALLAQAAGEPMPPRLHTHAAAMERAVAVLTRPDGRPPMLGDTVQDEPAPVQVLHDLARLLLPDAPPPVTASALLPDAGYAVLRQGEGKRRMYVCFDTGDLGPDHCPGHGHADMLALEVWVGDQPLWLDPGTYQYQGGAKRDAYRGTSGHTTLTMDGLDQVAFVGPFRIADLGHARLVHHDLGPSRDEVTAEHDGYVRLPGKPRHARTVVLEADGCLTVTDTVSGTGTHDLLLHFHFAPGCRVTCTDAGAHITLQNGTACRLHLTGGGTARLETGCYSAHMFHEEKITVLRYGLRATLPATLGFCLETDPDA